MAKRGRDSLRFGPLKPVGFTDPATGKRPFAVVQLRKPQPWYQSFGNNFVFAHAACF
jgi:folate-dependent tRNA-U54 methylase TrmFO/GidA